MIHSIAQKEFISTLRDRRFAVLSMVVLLLLLAATIVGMHNYRTLQQERDIAQHTVNDQWVNQPDRHPHRVAHYGSFAFRPKSSISFLDFGIDSFTGTSVYLEAHKQNSANFSQAQQSGSLIRFGEMTVAFVLQLLIPLLIIFLCFGAFTQEKEIGTMKMLLSQGATLRQVALEKVKGYSQVVALIVLPALVLASLLLFGRNGFEMNQDLGFRMLLFITFYAIYFFLFIAGSVIISALYQQSRTSLITLLAIWITCCILIPKATANIGASLYPTPTKARMDADIHEEVQKGVDGHQPQNERAEALKKQLLTKYGVDSLQKLPVNFDGIIMAEGEESSSRAYQKHFKELQQTFENQNRISVWAGFINPYLAIRHLSMSVAGSDFHHFIHFQEEAENYRYGFVQRLNELQATKLKYGDKAFRLSRNTWRQFKPFSYQAPSVGWSLGNQLLSIAALLCWLLLVCVVGYWVIPKTSIV